MDNDALPYVLLALSTLCGPVFLLVCGLLSKFSDRAFDAGWRAACEAFGLDADERKICD